MAQRGEDLHYDRFWLLTWTTYGSWLPGDDRGSTGIIHDQSGQWLARNEIGEPFVDPSNALRDFSREAMKGDEVRLNLEQGPRPAHAISLHKWCSSLEVAGDCHHGQPHSSGRQRSR